MSTPAKLVPEGSSGAPAAVPSSVPDNDANEAVNAVLSEAGVDRASVEGTADTVILPETKDTSTPPRGPDGKFLPGDKPADKPAETDPSKAAAPAATPTPAAGADLDIPLTAEDLSVIEKNPILRRVYKTMERGLTRKFEELAEQRKANEADLNLIAGIRKDPIPGIRALAAALGLPLPAEGAGAAPAAAAAAPPPAATPLAVAEAALGKVFPPEGAKALAPALVEIARAVALAEVQPLLKPIQTDLQAGREELAVTREARMQAQLVTALGEFGRGVESRGDDWSMEIQKEMSKLIGVVNPGKKSDGTSVTLPEYLDVLYNHVTAKRSHEAMKARQLARLRAAAETAEPTPVRTTPSSVMGQRITAEMSDAEADALAVQQTLAELQGR